ncbi:glycosyltransferase [Saccharothrix obliqua]|uniref:glycosyltransferase n=1 Tax=Saccharothrix obliqua TaxID=2861747 RepID=UPI001C5D9E9D|nr:glycosyltransferase [Saccharothrix obliqua]MBW4718136.1 glycosyltransferase [Saccharothrix obliqua]
MSGRSALHASAVVTAAAGLVGVVSFAGTMVMAHLLPTGQFTVYSAAHSLLTTVGVVSGALVPLPLARVVRAHRTGEPERRSAVAFASTVALSGGVVAAVVVFAIVLGLASPVMAVLTGISALAVFAASPVWGWMQGESRFGLLATVAVAEVLLRLALAFAAVALGFGASGAIAGYAVGTVAVVVLGLVVMWPDRGARLDSMCDRDRWKETVALASVQFTVSALVSADVVLVAVVAAESAAGAGYQAVAAIAKGPVYVAASAALVSFPALRNASRSAAPRVAGEMLRSFARLALPVTAVIATVPTPFIGAILPGAYLDSVRLVPWLAVAGLGSGAVSTLVMVLLGSGALRRCWAGLAVSAVIVPAGLVTGWASQGTIGMALGAAAGTCLSAAFCLALAWRSLPGALGSAAWRALPLLAVLTGTLVLARFSTLLWSGVAVVAAVAVLRPRDGESKAPGRRLDVLHLGFEDVAMPGAGGGALRTHEINKRLAAAGHRVTVLVTRFPGCRDRVEDGVRYVHVGIGAGRTLVGRVAGYALTLPYHVRRFPADLVVEDFFAPISTMAAPLWTGRPTVGVVQWLNARGKSDQYHLPFHRVERFGVRRHRDLIAVSHGVAGALRELNPHADVEVIGNGVDPAAFTPPASDGDDVVYVGRLEAEHKGLYALLHAWTTASRHTGGDLVIAGTGPDEAALRTLAEGLGIAHRVRFVGWISGTAKFELMARARLVVVPSQYESFGIVAVEAMATGTPVLAFDIPCLREVVPAGCGELVPPFDVAGYADAIVRGWHRRKTPSSVDRAKRFASSFDWDMLARCQENVYLRRVHGRTAHSPTAVVRAQVAGLGRGRARSRPPRLVLVGDVAADGITEWSALLAARRALDEDAGVTVLSGVPERIGSLLRTPAVRLTVGNLVRAFRGCDGIVVAGTAFGPGMSVAGRLLPHLAAIARCAGRDVVYVGIGVRDGLAAHVLRSLRRAAAGARAFTVRDRRSFRHLDSRRARICHVGDTGVQVPSADPAVARRLLHEAGLATTRPILLLVPEAPVDGTWFGRVAEDLVTAARTWLAGGGSAAVVGLSRAANGTDEQERTTASLIHAIAAAAGDVALPVLGPDLTPPVVRAVLGEADAVLGQHLHLLLTAWHIGVPCACSTTDEQIGSLVQEHGLPVLNGERAAQWLDSIIRNPILIDSRRYR